MKIKTCFAASYYAETRTASMRKLPVVAQLAEQQGFAQLVDPGSIDPEKLRRLHNPFYVEAFLSGEGALARHGPHYECGALLTSATEESEMVLPRGLAPRTSAFAERRASLTLRELENGAPCRCCPGACGLEDRRACCHTNDANESGGCVRYRAGLSSSSARR